MLGQLSRQQKSDGSLYVTAHESRLLVVLVQVAGLGGDALKDVSHERVHDRHGLRGDAYVRVHLLQDAANVSAEERLATLLLLFLLFTRNHGNLLDGLVLAERGDGGRNDTLLLADVLLDLSLDLSLDVAFGSRSHFNLVKSMRMSEQKVVMKTEKSSWDEH